MGCDGGTVPGGYVGAHSLRENVWGRCWAGDFADGRGIFMGKCLVGNSMRRNIRAFVRR